MNQSHANLNQSPALSELFARYVRNQTAASEQGLGWPESTGEVVPHEAVPVQPVDPQLAWNDALAAAHTPASRPATPPPDWAQLVAAQEPALAVAFALGNFPQLVRNLHPLLAGGDLTKLRDLPGRPVTVPGLLDWASEARDGSQRLLAAGVLRLARHFDRAAERLRPSDAGSEEDEALRANEEAALLWHRGQCEEAAQRWQALPASVPVLFNRGMAALFLGRRTEAQAALTQAVAQLPDTSAWHHLGKLYLALAGTRQ